MNARRTAVVPLALAAIVAVLPVAAQQRSAAHVAALWTLTSEAASPLLHAFEQGLAERGWVAGKNIEIEHRFSGGRPDAVMPLAAELVAAGPDVLFAGSEIGAVALRQQTTTIPIVVGAAPDALRSGLATSLARPGGNVTGMAAVPELHAKRMQMLREAVPGLACIGVLYNPVFTATRMSSTPSWTRRAPRASASSS